MPAEEVPEWALEVQNSSSVASPATDKNNAPSPHATVTVQDASKSSKIQTAVAVKADDEPSWMNDEGRSSVVDMPISETWLAVTAVMVNCMIM